MFVITLADGSQHKFNRSMSVIEIIQDINPNLGKACIATQINGKLTDISEIIKYNAQLTIITNQDDIGINIIRCSCICLLGQAIKQLWPNAKMVRGSLNEKEFYYDVDLDYIITQHDLLKLENHMHQLAKKKYNIIKQQTTWCQARNIFLERQEEHKVSFIDKQHNHKDFIYLYYYEEYVDIYSGLHVPNISFCRHFILQNISGVYWKSNNTNKMLQRISGSAWGSKEQLDNYLEYLTKIAKHDHRIINKYLKLYHMQEEAPGMVFWHHNGWIIFRELENFIRIKLNDYQYQEVKGPLIMDRILWEKTGHVDNYSNYIFNILTENREYCIKPMNCPGHVLIFNHGLKSYRDLPFRIAEFGSCHRNEPSGSLHGLMRVRGFTQDDAHIFCTEKQVFTEVSNCIKMIYDIYITFGFKNIFVKLSTRPIKRVGDDCIWDWSENILSSILKNNNISFNYQPGDGAFYGPKIEFILLDSLNRKWQCGTIQLDFALPKYLNAIYIDENNKRITPVMIHRAILGSIERFIGILTEEYAGFYPTWLAPVQVVVINITSNQLNYVLKLTKRMLIIGIRVKSDVRNEKIGFKIREHTLHRIPYMFICGDREMNTYKVTVRTYHGKNLGQFNFDEIITRLQHEIHNRNLHQLED